MSGLDKILEQIKTEAEQTAARIKADAQAQADRILQDAQAQAERELGQRRQAAEAEADLQRERTAASCQLKRQQQLLLRKQEIIRSVIEEARERLLQLPEDEYFDMLLSMAGRYASAGEGRIYFSERDLKRLPADFEQRLNAELADKQASLKVSDESRRIDGGFVLSYGGIEENSSLRAIFDTAYEQLQDLVQKELFSAAET